MSRGSVPAGELEEVAAFEEAYVFPLSYPQERLWFLEQLTPGLAVFNVPLAVRLRGRLDQAALAAALAATVRRHEVLRTSFRTEDGRPVQVIAPAAAVRVQLPVVDLRGLREGRPSADGGPAPAPRRKAPLEASLQEASLQKASLQKASLKAARQEAARLADEEAGRVFDLRQGPLVRARLLWLDDAEHLLLLTLHHMVSDRWSMGILLAELAAGYAREPLPELPLQYADYAVWQREWLQGEVLERQLSYWRERLAGMPELQLPADRRRPAVQSHRGSQVRAEIPAPLAAALRRLSGEEGVTLFMTLLAGFLVLLARYSGAEEVAVGTAVANRGRRELEGLAGFFVNTLVLRVDLEGEPSFRQLLARVREVTLGAFMHQELPFDRLVEELRPARDASRAPLVQVTFLLQNTPLPSLRLPGIELEEVPSRTRTAKFDLSVALSEGDGGIGGDGGTGGMGGMGGMGGIGGTWEYDADLFEPATVERMAEQYQRLLAAAAANPAADVSDLLPAGEAEAAAMLESFNRGLE